MDGGKLLIGRNKYNNKRELEFKSHKTLSKFIQSLKENLNIIEFETRESFIKKIQNVLSEQNKDEKIYNNRLRKLGIQ